MIPIQFDAYDFKIQSKDGVTSIFDIIRKKYVVLTPEEWVRQHIVWYFIEVLQYPKHLISVEKKILVNNLSKRYDIIVYDRTLQPWMLVECKEPKVPISEKTLQQLLHYQKTIQSPYGMITNGNTTYCCHFKIPGFSWLTSLPVFPL